MPTALVTGASRGLGLALARALAGRGYRLVVDARGPEALERARAELAEATDVVALAGDVTDERHRRALVGAAGPQLDLLVNNASLLGPSPQPGLTEYPLDVLRRVYEANVLAPLALVQLAVPLLPAGAAIVNVTSDAAVEPYEGWGGYGSSKAALEQGTRGPAGARWAAPDPPEARGLGRAGVRLLVSCPDGTIEHATARDLPRFLDAGDLLVVNTSRTIPVALEATAEEGTVLDLHLSTPAPGAGPDAWLVELRRAGRRFRGARAGEVLALPEGGEA